jgi:glycosyltransferase involved in cell wall biosynthesis
MKKKMLIFHPALAPYRIDQFNALNQIYELKVVFIFENLQNNKFDQHKLLSLLQFEYAFLLKGLFYKNRGIRFGILKTIKKFKPDIICGYEYSITTQYLILLKRLGLIHQKIGSTIDDSIEICNHIQSKIRSLARKISIKQLDFIIVMSNEVLKFYMDTFKLKENQIIVSPVLQDPERLRTNSDEIKAIAREYSNTYQLKGKKVLLFVGRFMPEKALPAFLSSIQYVLQKQDNVIFILIGDGSDRNNIENLIKEKKLDTKVIAPGRYEASQLYAWYLCASGFVLPSIYEPFGAVVNEALIFGIKVFCSRYAGASYLVTSEKGIVFNPLSEKDVTSKFEQFLNLLDITGDLNLENRPSLMVNYKNDFIYQWGKLNNA